MPVDAVSQVTPSQDFRGPELEQVAGADGYPLGVRAWRAEAPVASLVILHGIVSHSGWLDPIASRLAALGIDVICPDRRGSGRSDRQRGDAPSGAVLLDDLGRVMERCAVPGVPLHLCGFCWGAVYALRYLGITRPAVRSLLLLAPGIYPAPELTGLPLVTGDSEEPTELPLVPLDAFTRGPAYQEFILPDPFRLQRVSPRFNSIVAEFSRLITTRLARLTVPTLCVLAETDRISDNDAMRRAFDLIPARPRMLASVPGEHGVQFDAPEESAALMYRWMASRSGDPTS